MTKKRWAIVGGLLLMALAAGAAAAAAALPFSADGVTINGCYSPGGSLKVLTPAEPTCPKGYTAINWSVAGPQGAQGAQGPQGPQGPTGTFTSVVTSMHAGPSVEIGTFGYEESHADCPNGSTVVAGAMDLTDSEIAYSRRDGNGWVVRAGAGLFGGHVRAYAVCLSVS